MGRVAADALACGGIVALGTSVDTGIPHGSYDDLAHLKLTTSVPGEKETYTYTYAYAYMDTDTRIIHLHVSSCTPYSPPANSNFAPNSVILSNRRHRR